MNKNAVNFTIYFTAGMAIGVGAGYLLAKKKYRLLAEEEIASVKDIFKKVRAEDKTHAEDQARADWSADLETAKEVIDFEDYDSRSETPEGLTTVEIGIRGDDVKVSVEEQTRRDESAPYLITIEEYMGDRHDFAKTTATYWEEDDTIVNDDEKPMDDVNEVIGNDNLMTFGSDPEEPDMIWVRNEHLEVDFEIARDQRSYHEVVLGIKNWNSNGINTKQKKMRGDG